MKLKTAFATLVATIYMASFGVVGATGTLSDTVLSQYGASGIAGNSLKGSGSDWVSQLLYYTMKRGHKKKIITRLICLYRFHYGSIITRYV